MVAKSYQKFEIAGDPYLVNGRYYVKLVTGKQVRWYNEHEYYKMYPEEKASAQNSGADTTIRPLKEVLGFDKGYVTICKGDTYSHLEWFKESNFRYSKFFGWYLISTLELPEDLPEDLIPVQLKWEDVSNDNGTKLKSEAELKRAVENIIYDPSPSQHYGMIGDRVNLSLTVVKAIPMENIYFNGLCVMHIFEDDNQNVFVWTTTSKNLKVGSTYEIRGTIKDHAVFHNCNQTILTRCFVSEKK